MPTVLILSTKHTPKVAEFMQECNKIMGIKGFHLVSSPSNPNIFFANYQKIPKTELNSLLKQIKAITTFNQAISNLYVSHNMSKG